MINFQVKKLKKNSKYMSTLYAYNKIFKVQFLKNTLQIFKIIIIQIIVSFTSFFHFQNNL
jgi:hypothetical protein